MSEKKKISDKKRVKEEGSSYFRSPQKHECHSHIAPFDKKEWHSSFAPYFGSGAQEWRSGVALKRVPLFNTLRIGHLSKELKFTQLILFAK
jgi:hypothetical protein